MQTPNHLSKKELDDRKSIFTVKIVPQLNTHGLWKTEASDEADPMFSFTWIRADQAMGEKADGSWCAAYEVTEKFINLRTRSEALEFFEEFGPLQQTEPQPKTDWKRTADPVRLSSVMSLGQRFSTALSKSDPADPERYQKAAFDWYRTQPLQIELHWTSPFVATKACKDVQECVLATSFLDSLNGLTWGRCARKRCPNKFRRDHKNGKIYCSEACARHQAQIAHLERKKRAKQDEEKTQEAGIDKSQKKTSKRK